MQIVNKYWAMMTKIFFCGMIGIRRKLAQEIDTESHEKAENFSFSKCQISVGEEIEYYADPSIKCKVVGDRKVEYQGKGMSLTAAAKLISGKKYSITGLRFFKYKGE